MEIRRRSEALFLFNNRGRLNKRKTTNFVVEFVKDESLSINDVVQRFQK